MKILGLIISYLTAPVRRRNVRLMATFWLSFVRREAAAVVITTHDDDVNIYLTIYVRRLRPEVQVIARANVDRNVTTLYRAGADAVLSYASTGSAAIWNWFRPHDSLLVAEHLEVFRSPVPAALVGQTVEACGIGVDTGCAVVALRAEGVVDIDPDPSRPLTADMELILIGDDLDRGRFESTYGAGNGSRRVVTLRRRRS